MIDLYQQASRLVTQTQNYWDSLKPLKVSAQDMGALVKPKQNHAPINLTAARWLHETKAPGDGIPSPGYNTGANDGTTYTSDEQRGVIMAVAWYYHDEATGVRYYTESYTMSVTEFAEVVSRLVGHKVSASDTSQAQRWKDLERFSNTKHI